MNHPLQHTSTVTVDNIQLYASKGAKLHPLLYVVFLDLLGDMEHQHRVCPIPLTIFQRFNFKHQKTA